MKFKILYAFLLITIQLSAQDSFYSYLELGEYNVAFTDSLIYCEAIEYNQFGYKGPAPVFLKIWHPSQKQKNDFLTFSDFQFFQLPQNLEMVYAQLLKKVDSFFIKSYFESYEIKSYYDIVHAPVDFGHFSNQEVLFTLKNLKTISQLGRLKTKKKFPVIVYHHGAQSAAEENFIFAEYFASHGFIVISASYHLPFENKVYGYEPKDFDDTALPRRVCEFARSITSENVYFIGHSAGAQVGFHFLFEKGMADGFVSLETTTEFWRKQSIRKGWKSLYKIVRKHKKDYDLPILMIANTGSQINPFPLYDEIENPDMIHASSKVYFDHESYTSLYHMRYLFRDPIPQKDTANSKSQLNLYFRHLFLIEEFIESIENNKKMDFNSYHQDFFFTDFEDRKEK